MLVVPAVLFSMTPPSLIILLTTLSPRAVTLKPHSLTLPEAQNETPSWAASSVPSGVSQEDLADAQQTEALVDRRYRVDVAKALGVYKSTGLSPQDAAELKKSRPAGGQGGLGHRNSPA
ncbi:hypothetical protein RRG08_040407 [Elysia crispata]|uniref:Uncharacterized protein n=1 Tax=Elysia crispata TaxID=231223 RepID=A0AAE0ZCI1_9GAST|nr:hypothetical protein RRG08_040407 [Elysia crispata]